MSNSYLGIDIVENKRINKKKFVNRFLSEKEYEKFLSFSDRKAALNFAIGRWAAKEAIIKATNKLYSISEIEIFNEENGNPIVFLRKEYNKNCKVSISHEKKYTIAICIMSV
ncbi:MAG: holo-ACP synthase [Candidatus Hepatoplasma vulgare]|nr:MAG: holo-ACP synthase [Candidatus Hepatoplasma sp.]